MSNEDEIQKALANIEELMAPISPGQWDWSSHKPKDKEKIESVDDVVALLTESARKGTGLYLHGVCAKDGDEDITVCYTGNGPRSAANARFLANAPDAIRWLLKAYREAKAEIESHHEETEQVCGYKKLIDAEARVKELEHGMVNPEWYWRKHWEIQSSRAEAAEARAKAATEAEPFSHCRLEQEYLMAVVRNRSGIDSGEIDYSIPISRFERQTIPSLEAMIRELEVLKTRCQERITELATPQPPAPSDKPTKSEPVEPESGEWHEFCRDRQGVVYFRHLEKDCPSGNPGTTEGK